MGSVLGKKPGRGWLVSFAQDDTLRDLLGSKREVLHDEYIISDYPADILLSDTNRSKQISPNVWFLEGNEQENFIYLQCMFPLDMSTLKSSEE